MKTQANAVSLLRTYCRFVNSVGVPVYIPDDDYTIRTPKYHPYLFTDRELVSLFNAFDSVQPHPYGPGREYIFPVLFRMMYCCGMRPTEPLRLKTGDVDLHTGGFISGSQSRTGTGISLCRMICSGFAEDMTLLQAEGNGSSRNGMAAHLQTSGQGTRWTGAGKQPAWQNARTCAHMT